MDKRRVRAAFSRGAAAYDQRAEAQARVRERIVALADRVAPQARRILDVGAGTGALAATLVARRPALSIALVDLAPGMCAAARRAVPGARVATADAEALPFAAGTFDAVLSSSTLQWLPRLESALAELRRVLAPGGALVLSLFTAGTLRELRAAWAEVAGADGAARLHEQFTAGDVVTAAAAAGLEIDEVREEDFVEHHPDARSVLRSIKAVGAGNAVPGASDGLGGRRLTLALLDRYDAAWRGPSGVPASYRALFLVARRP